jgi:hypothetical protein
VAELTVEDFERRVQGAIDHARAQMAFHEASANEADDEAARTSATILFMSFASVTACLEKILEPDA